MLGPFWQAPMVPTGLFRSKLRLCSANHWPYYWSNLPCYWTSTTRAYSEKETKTGPRHRAKAPSQYPKRRLFIRSRKVSKLWDLFLEVSDRSEIWQAHRQQCCRCACQISKRYDNLKCQSRDFETSRDLTIRRLFGYWDGAQDIYNRHSNSSPPKRITEIRLNMT